MSPQHEITMIVPAGAGGIVDFCSRLANWFKLRDIGVAVTVRAIDNECAELQWSAERVGNRTLLLHLSHYGYEKRGVPTWLVRWVNRQRPHVFRVGVYFHELYAKGAPWRSSFWLSPFQRLITTRLLAQSDFWLTNRRASADWLAQRGGTGKPSVTFPVISNVGEQPAEGAARHRRLIVFGSAALRERTYRATLPVLPQWARELGLEIHDVGDQLPDRALESSLASWGVMLHGRQSAKLVSELLASAQCGLVKYPVAFIAKSGVFAAYSAHGVCPIVVSREIESCDGLQHGVNFLSWDAVPDPVPFDIVGREASRWYSDHSLGIQGEALFQLMRGSTRKK